METKVETLESGKTKLTVSFEAAEIAKLVENKYKEVARQSNFKGFRKGRVPRPVINNAFGKDYVCGQVTDELINSTFPVAIDQNDLCYIGQPAIDENVDLVVDNQPYTYFGTMDLKPEYELSSYEPVSIEKLIEDAPEDEVEDSLKRTVEQYYYELNDADADEVVVEGGYADISLRATNAAGEDVPVYTSDSRTYQLGQNIFGDEFDAQLVGMKAGDSKTFDVDVDASTSMMLGIFKGKTPSITFTVGINTVKVKELPEMTDEWAKSTLGFDDMASFKKQIADRIIAEKQQANPTLIENGALRELVDRLQGEAPEVMAEESEQELMQRFFTQLQKAGQTLDTYLANNNMTQDDFKADLKKQAADSVKENLALDSWARYSGITVSDEEVHNEFLASGLDNPEQMYLQYAAQGNLHIIREGILRGKALEAVINGANITEVRMLTEEEPEAEAEEPAAEAAAEEPTAEADAE